MSGIGATLFASGLAFVLYTYVGYPLLLRLLALARLERPQGDAKTLPTISITLPAYNEAAQIEETLDTLLAVDYPLERRQILVVSDASTDETDELVARYADRGVELVRMPRRVGKTGAENNVRGLLRGDVVINTDASVRIDSAALRALVAALGDPTVGVASGRDVSVGSAEECRNTAESDYVGYEMWVRDLESRVGGIVGASGCLYAIRRDLHMNIVPEALSRDFASALIAREHGYRSVSVPEAICYVPRTPSPRREYRRKVRTMTRGMETLFFKRHLLNPARHGLFAWMLWSHKVCRWLVPWALTATAMGLLLLTPSQRWAAIALTLGILVACCGVAGIFWPRRLPLPHWIAVVSYGLSGNVAAMHALLKALRGELNPVWEPTHRPSSGPAAQRP